MHLKRTCNHFRVIGTSKMSVLWRFSVTNGARQRVTSHQWPGEGTDTPGDIQTWSFRSSNIEQPLLFTSNVRKTLANRLNPHFGIFSVVTHLPALYGKNWPAAKRAKRLDRKKPNEGASPEGRHGQWLQIRTRNHEISAVEKTRRGCKVWINISLDVVVISIVLWRRSCWGNLSFIRESTQWEWSVSLNTFSQSFRVGRSSRRFQHVFQADVACSFYRTIEITISWSFTENITG